MSAMCEKSTVLEAAMVVVAARVITRLAAVHACAAQFDVVVVRALFMML